jgi:hypothetical protein
VANCAENGETPVAWRRSGTNVTPLGCDPENEEADLFKGGLLWLIGIPIPIILLLLFFGVL